MDLKYRRWWKMYYRHLTALFVEDIREEGDQSRCTGNGLMRNQSCCQFSEGSIAELSNYTLNRIN